MESLVQASMGLVKLGKDYYLQIITADKYKFYYAPISKELAELTLELEGLSCHTVQGLPDSCMLLPGFRNRDISDAVRRKQI